MCICVCLCVSGCKPELIMQLLDFFDFGNCSAKLWKNIGGKTMPAIYTIVCIIYAYIRIYCRCLLTWLSCVRKYKVYKFKHLYSNFILLMYLCLLISILGIKLVVFFDMEESLFEVREQEFIKEILRFRIEISHSCNYVVCHL